MSVLQLAVAPQVLDAPVRRFRHYQAAVLAMADYQATLIKDALRRRSDGLAVNDQDQPEAVFCLVPARCVHPPLTIIGGMGPVAGAHAFRQACTHFQDSRAVVLYQACAVPDRSKVILGERRPDTRLCHAMALRLADAVRLAVDLAPPASQPPRCIIACNTAHYFWQLMTDDLQQTAARPCKVQMISLVESSLGALKFLSCRKTLLLETEGSRTGTVYSARCLDAGIAFDEPSPTQSRLLMRSIYEGMKSLDERRAVELGNQFFETILESSCDYDCILAGCSELPLIIDLLRLRGSPAVAAFLSRVKVVDPMEEALRYA